MIQKIFIVFFCFNLLAMEEGPIRVLSLDGGGIRGILSAFLLAHIEEETQKPISEHFDLIAGSSIGGIMALALSVPNEEGKPKYSAKDVINIFVEHGDDVFYRSLSHSITTLGGLLGPKYEAYSIEKLLKDYFGDTNLSQLLTNVMVTGYHMEGQVGVEFASDDAKKFPLDKDCLVWQVARATSAAPYFFDSAHIKYSWGELNHVVDGGIYANNPALHAYFGAKRLYPNRKIEVYSLGTGDITIEELGEELSGRGLIRWVSPILRHMQSGNISSNNDILYKLLNEDGEENFYRINIKLNKDHRSMDDFSKENLKYLTKKGHEATKMPIYLRMLNKLKYS